MVEAIEDLFIPVLIYNNKAGADADLLKQFKESSWNNPVTRFIDENGVDLIERKDGVWQMQAMARRMVKALKAADQSVPRFLTDLAINKSGLEVATFGMHCYWVGESKLGQITGVTNTISGWEGGLEVVHVTFDPKKVEYMTLLKTALAFECATQVFVHNESQLKAAKQIVGNNAVKAPSDFKKAKLSDQKYHLRNTADYRHLPLTTYQSTKINSLAIDRNRMQAAQEILSPRQRTLLATIQANPPSEMGNFIFPENDSKLHDYQHRLLHRLSKLKTASQ